MVSRQPERYIPDVRDVFQRQSNGRGPTVGQQQQQPPQQGRYLFRDEHSDEEHYDYNGRTTKSNSRSGGGGGGAVASPPRQKRNNNNNNGNSEHSMLGRNNDYSKTLTEKDLKHIERHLSMKKTIRKQLSRHLSKAFVESEAEATAGQPTAATTTTKAAAITPSRSHHPNGPNNSSSSTSANYSLTFNKSNVAKSESNFLDLLKEAGNDEFDGDDSGHCSPTTEMDRARMMDQQWLTNRFNSSSSLNPTTSRNNNVSAAASAPEGNEAKKSNFWKKLTVRSKSKR